MVPTAHPVSPGPQIANASCIANASQIANTSHVANASCPGAPGRDGAGTAKMKLLRRVKANAHIFPSCKISLCNKGNRPLVKKLRNKESKRAFSPAKINLFFGDSVSSPCHKNCFAELCSCKNLALQQGEGEHLSSAKTLRDKGNTRTYFF